MIDELKNIFKKPAPEIRRCLVVSQVSPGVYTVRDDGGITLRVQSATWRRPGEYVTVQGLRIVAGANAPKSIKTYEV